MNKLHQDFQQGDKLKLNCAVEYSGRCRRLKGEFIDKPLSSVFEIFTLDSASVFGRFALGGLYLRSSLFFFWVSRREYNMARYSDERKR